MTVTTRLTAAAIGLGIALTMAKHAGADFARERSLETESGEIPALLEHVERLTSFPPGYRFTGSGFRADLRWNRARIEVSALNAKREEMAGSLAVRGFRVDPSKRYLIYERDGQSAICGRIPSGRAPWSRGFSVRPSGDCEVRAAAGSDGSLTIGLAVRFASPAHLQQLASR